MAPSHKIGVALSTESPCIVLAVLVLAVDSIVLAAVQIVTVVAHAFGIVLAIRMWAICYFHYLFFFGEVHVHIHRLCFLILHVVLDNPQFTRIFATILLRLIMSVR